jgi:hypothetical protein
MKKNRSIYKVVCASLLFLISPSHIVSAMEGENTEDLSNDFKNLFSTKTQTVPDYNKILEEIEELTKRIHAEVDKVLADYRRDTEEYHRRMGITRGTATSVAPGTVEKEESQPEAQEKEKEEKEKEELKKLAKKEWKALIDQLEEDLTAGVFSSAFKAMENYQKKYPNVTLRKVREIVVNAFIEKQKGGDAAQEQNAQEFLKLAELPENDAAYISAARHCLKVFEDKERISELLEYDTKTLFKVLGAIKIFQVNHVKDAPTYEDIRDLGSVIKAPGEEGKPGAEEQTN